MGFAFIIGMMLYSVGMCLLFQWVGRRSPHVRQVEREWNHPAVAVVVPDRVPSEWVNAYRAEQGGGPHPAGKVRSGDRRLERSAW